VKARKNVLFIGYPLLAVFCIACSGAVTTPSGKAPQKPGSAVAKKEKKRTRPAVKKAAKRPDSMKAPVAALPKAAVPASEAKGEKPALITPRSVRPLMQIEAGRNDSNPTWSTTGKLIAVERSKGDKKEIVIARPDGSIVQTVYYQLSSDNSQGMEFFFPGLFEDVSYNAGISWSPKGDRIVFMSNGGEGNYDCYLRELGSKKTVRLTKHKEKDGQAHWSPVDDVVVFVSGRTGRGDIYLMDIGTREITRLTQGGKAYLYPQWSPKGKKVALIHGSNENHDIYVINDVKEPVQSLTALTSWKHDDLRPVWSPDGKKIAFYSNYNPEDDPKVWSLIVIAADGSDPKRGQGLSEKVVATDVIPDVERGPAWMPDSERIVYVKNDRQKYNPLYVVDIEEKTNLPLKTNTKMNHDVSCSAKGLISFRAQVRRWDHVFIAELKR